MQIADRITTVVDHIVKETYGGLTASESDNVGQHTREPLQVRGRAQPVNGPEKASAQGLVFVAQFPRQKIPRDRFPEIS